MIFELPQLIAGEDIEKNDLVYIKDGFIYKLVKDNCVYKSIDENDKEAIEDAYKNGYEI